MSDKTRVLLLAEKFELRGSSHSTIRLCTGLHKHEIDFEIITPDARLLPEELCQDWTISEYQHLSTPVWGKLVQKLIGRDLLDHPPQLIHVQSTSLARFGVQLSKLLNAPCLLNIQHPPQPNAKWLKSVNHFERIIAVSRAVKSRFLEMSDYPADHVIEIHNGVIIPELDDEQEILGADHLPVVGMAGPLEPVKGVPYFLGAAQKVLNKYPKVEFLVAGAGPEEANLRRLAHELKISPHVTFAPNVVDFSIPLQAMDLFCLPSLEQGLGTIMLEAMAMARPVIASSVGGVDSIIRDNKNGWVVPAAESGPLTEKILYALKHRDQAREIGLKGQDLVRKKFSVEQMVNYTVEVYHEILQNQEQPAETE